MITAWWGKALAMFAGNGLAFAALAGLGMMALTWDMKRMSAAREVGRQEVRVQLEKNSHDNAKKADAARRDVERLPADRLRDRWFRD